MKYADVVSGGEGFTMVVRLSGGLDATIEAPFMISKSKDRNYAIRNVPGDVPKVAHRSNTKRRMDTTVMVEWPNKRHVISALTSGSRRALFEDICSGHSKSVAMVAAAGRYNTDIYYFLP